MSEKEYKEFINKLIERLESLGIYEYEKYWLEEGVRAADFYSEDKEEHYVEELE